MSEVVENDRVGEVLELDEVEQAKKVLEEDRARRVLACTKEVSEILKKHNCEMKFSIILESK